ncbi:hypothetical protein NY537_17745 [Curtobacterium flaccumfaciens pv. betae]|uniref:hypothetical protein n=1 Tax=Curtobacterium flaccumfaciens TaxID=2035 RepID=UPI002659EA8A|nr:hypothetical protein [Curtobacterium flaccumfaciens]MCS5514585.1 hypothetical protein [Curtobacterium flaccumfaciens pv. betae]
MPTPVVNYAELAQKSIRDKIIQQLTKPTPLKGVVATDARILGRHYVKQVDVVMSAWETGPEILISTKRMDSSFGKNAANRIEEAYGDAKNLRARHPLAAHGFLYGLRSTILDSEPDKARWLIDLLAKLAHEGDAYNAVCLLMLDYDGKAPEGSDGGHDDDEDAAAVGLSTEFSLERLSGASVAGDEADADNPDSSESTIVLPKVSILAHPEIPEELTAGSFFKRIVELVLRSTPITMHPQARQARGWPTAGLAVDETDV